LQFLASLGLPLSQAFGTQTGTTSGTAGQQGAQYGNQIGNATTTINPSLLQNVQGWAQVFGNLLPKVPGGGATGGISALPPM
jgi:hypothetical protein